MTKEKLIGKKVKIISDNILYKEFRNKPLICVEADNRGIAYDTDLYPQNLCSFKTLEGKDFEFSLYECEFKLL